MDKAEAWQHWAHKIQNVTNEQETFSLQTNRFHYYNGYYD